MKYKIIGLFASVVLILATGIVMTAKTDETKYRVHQHLEARQPTEGCNCDKKTLCTHLPLVMIDTKGKAIPGEPKTQEKDFEVTLTEEGETMLNAKIQVIDNQERNNHPNDKATLESSMRIRIRGNSSRFYDKKNYLIRLTDKNGKYRKEEVMGMEKHYEWALHGPYLDKSLIRNYMWYNITGEIMEYSPNVRFCEVILNGEYKGLYLMTETITSGKDSRLNLTEPLKNLNKTGFLVRLDRGSSNEDKNITPFTSYTYRNLKEMDIQYPRSGDLTPELIRSITREISDFEKALYSYDYNTNNYGYWNFIDVNNFINYFIINEFTLNYDAGWLSTYLYKDIGGKYKMAVWDFNSACNNYIEPMDMPQRLYLQMNIWYFMLSKDKDFTENLLIQYKKLRKSYLNEAYLNQYIDEVILYLGDAIDRNFTVWGDSLKMDMVNPPERNVHSYEEAVDQLKQSIHERGTWLDRYMETILQYSHESKVKKFNH